MFTRYFTPQEAKKRLPLIKKIVGEILLKGKALRKFLEQGGSNSSPQAETLHVEI